VAPGGAESAEKRKREREREIYTEYNGHFFELAHALAFAVPTILFKPHI
jgi:hypothetical protein